MALGTLHFGGPDRPPRYLRDLLQHHVDASPAGSSIDWATYYFRDEALAESLIRASDRGVAVTLAVEAHPRRKGANDAVLARLGAHGLNGGLRLFAPSGPIRPHLHSKIYAFSGPEPVSFIGSFNPSGNEPEDADIIAEIGDQDRGHNLLLGISEPDLAASLARHARTIPTNGGIIASRLSRNHNRVVQGKASELYLFPRLRSAPVEEEIGRLGPGDAVRGAISHLKGTSFVTVLAQAAQRGVAIELVVHDTERRVPEADVVRLRAAGVAVRRFRHPAGLPMHAKFVLIARPAAPEAAWLGSANFNPRSRWINQEILLRTTDEPTVRGLAARFAEISTDPCAAAWLNPGRSPRQD